MKLTFLLVLSFGLFFLSSCGDDELELRGANCLPITLQSDIIGFYDFNNGSLLDDSVFGANLINNTSATPTTDRSGNTDCAFAFDNTASNDEFLSSTVSSQFNNLNSFSISAWYMPRPSDSSVLQGIVSRNDTIPTSCPDRRGEWSLSLYDCKKAVFGHNNAAWANLDLNQQFDCDEQMARLDNIWHHAVAVKAGNDYKIYYNGLLSELKSGDAQCNSLRKSRDIGDLFIGKNFTGSLDDIIIYSKALNDSEVMTLFDLGPCCE
jgi:hypothetical protein